MSGQGRVSERATIPEEVMLARLAQSEQMREFCIQMWLQNPVLAKQGGAKVQSLLSPLGGGVANESARPSCGASMAKQRGFTLIELLMFIVIVSVALAGILLVMNVTTKSSADPLVRKQALAIAESLLEEVQLQDFISADGSNTTVDSTNRSTDYHIVSDYHGFSMTGISSLTSDTVVGGLSGYSASVAVANAALGSVAAGSAVLITVTVDHPLGGKVELSGYRTAY